MSPAADSTTNPSNATLPTDVASWMEAATQLKSYVLAKDNTQYANVHKDMIIVDITHSNLKQRHIEIRFSLHDTIDNLRQIIHRKTGTPATFQHLQILNPASQVVLHEIPPDFPNSHVVKLGYFSLQHSMIIHCIDIDPYSKSANGQLEDVSLVEKYRMSEEEYNQRKGTLRDWERQQKEKDKNFTLAKHAKEHRELVEITKQYKLGYPLPEGYRVDPNNKQKIIKDENYEPRATTQKQTEEEEEETEETNFQSLPQNIQLQDRCQVQPGSRRGKVAYIGKVSELKGGGYWVGVQFDEPVGKSNGTIGDTVYFDAPDKYGGFVRGKNIEIGDFPEVDLFASDDDEDDEDEL